MLTLHHATSMPHRHAAVFSWHERPGALTRLLPPWEKVRVASHTPGFLQNTPGQNTPGPSANSDRDASDVASLIGDGAEVVIELKKGPMWLRWVAHHDGYTPGHRFRDTQGKGPFAFWQHTHRFVPAGDEASQLVDSILFALPGGVLGETLGGRFIKRDLNRTFRWRHLRTLGDLDRHAPFADLPRLRVLMSGSSGLIGSALSAFLTTGGHRVDRLVRRDADTDPIAAVVRGGSEHRWDPTGNPADPGTLEQHTIDRSDAVVHLAGVNVATTPWNDDNRAMIRDSRVKSTRLIAERIAASPTPPATLVLASAVGFYGDRPGELLTEDSPHGDGFLSSVVQEWEHAAQPAIDAGCRVVFARIGLVLAPNGGAMAALLPLARVGLGGRLGPGTQHWPWIGLDDCVGALHHLLMNERIDGAINVVAPGAETGGTTQAAVSRELATALRRPMLLDAPAWALRARFGEMADETVLKSANVSCERLIRSGFWFQHAELGEAIRWELGLV